jgi:hypothetical protein
MSTLNGTTLYNEGKAEAQAGRSGLVILDFGQPWVSGSTYGVTLFDQSFKTLAQIESALQDWYSGYYNWASSGMFMRVAAGTNNYAGSTGYNHGSEWGDMIDRLQAWIELYPNWGDKLAARGGIDVEAWMDQNNSSIFYGDPTDTADWADGYDAATSLPYYNYGSLDGCMPYGSCDGPFAIYDYWYASWGVSTAYPLPEIYYLVTYTGDTNGGNAAQWWELSLYGYQQQGGELWFLGSLTQYAASGGQGNTPNQGWQQLYNEMSADWRTSPGIADGIPYSTDITWSN